MSSSAVGVVRKPAVLIAAVIPKTHWCRQEMSTADAAQLAVCMSPDRVATQRASSAVHAGRDPGPTLRREF